MNLAIAALIRSRLTELGLSRGEFAKRLAQRGSPFKRVPNHALFLSLPVRTLSAIALQLGVSSADVDQREGHGDRGSGGRARGEVGD